MTRTQYEWNDTLTISSSSASGTYILQAPAITTTEDGSGTIKACTYDGYDGINPGTTGYHTTLTRGLLTREDRYATNCTPGSLSGLSSTQRAYDTSGNLLGVRDPDGQAGVPGHVNSTHCTISSVAYSACAQFDSLYSALPTVVYNALDQATTLNYTTDGANTNSPDATNGWGTWLTTSSDANGAATAFGYDALGRLTALAKPSDTLASSPTTSYQYVVTCAATGAAEPCTALQTTQRLTSGGQTVTSATYYDGWGRPVEAVTPEAQSGSTCTFAVQYTMYDSAGRVSFQSDPYFTTGLQPQGVCMPRYMRPDRTQPGSSTEYDGLDRTIKSYDAFQHLTSTSYSEAQPAAGAANVTDTAWYEATTVVDANGHQRSQLTDGFGRARYGETFTGDGTGTPAYTLYGMQAQTYDWLGNVLRGTGPNPPPGAAGLSASAQTTATYDLLGRKTALTDADLGSYSFPSYDANGNLRESVDPRGGTSGTVWIGYDGLNRPMWRNTTNTPTGAYVTYTYDETTQTGGHGSGIGRLTTESFSSGQSLGAGS
ncbi:MAG TPA: hypothetical protein VFU88_16380, partial [Ktedonobacterales bacterium]|nr:hypothetical protein [Ktedonobacterales bacterium]